MWECIAEGGVALARAGLLVCAASALAVAASAPPPEPVRLCEVLENPSAFAGRSVFLVGRYSFREHGLFLGEAGCASGPAPQPVALELIYDPKTGPKSPDGFALDTASLKRKLDTVRQSTSLGRFRFGSPEYDRWALVYGRIEIAAPDRVLPASGGRREEFRISGRLVCRGSGLVVFITEP